VDKTATTPLRVPNSFFKALDEDANWELKLEAPNLTPSNRKETKEPGIK
jgi:hypothetical protein